MTKRTITAIICLGVFMTTFAQKRGYKFHPEAERTEFCCFNSSTASNYEDDYKTVVYEDNYRAIRYLFYNNCKVQSKWIKASENFYASYSKREMIDYLIERGVLEQIDGKDDTQEATKYYTTKICSVHFWCDFF